MMEAVPRVFPGGIPLLNLNYVRKSYRKSRVETRTRDWDARHSLTRLTPHYREWFRRRSGKKFRQKPEDGPQKYRFTNLFASVQTLYRSNSA